MVNAAINKYIYIILNKPFDKKIRVGYSKTEIVDSIDQVQHPTAREALRLLEIDDGIEIVSLSDIPARIAGNGLGSSSSFIVGLLNALHAWKGELVSKEELAREAVKIEREILKEPGGKQDQYIAAYGGINMFEFGRDGTVITSPVIMQEAHRQEFRRHLLMLFTGSEHVSTAIHKEQVSLIEDKIASYDKMRDYAYTLYKNLASGDWAQTGKLLHENWLLKKTLSSGITNDKIDSLYEEGIRNGAEGGKIIGAGGGGFLLFFAKPELHSRIQNALGLEKVDFDFDYLGSRIIYVGD
ncbi:MAG: hypothetical protein QW719_02095 [Candidatus Micrarchaeaceae archaeon]